jgi:hypothetical protein
LGKAGHQHARNACTMSSFLDRVQAHYEAVRSSAAASPST